MTGYNDGCEIDPEIDVMNYKGMFAEEDVDTKFICPITGAHFQYMQLYRILDKVMIK